MDIIAHIENAFTTKFGIPRQSGLANSLISKIVFTPPYRVKEALRGMEGYTHFWLIWEFSEAVRSEWSPTVRPPRLGGNKRVGVFATRSPFRPNPLGLTLVKLEDICLDSPDGPILLVSGADLMNGTPIYDIKPYLPQFESIPHAACGFSGVGLEHKLQVQFPQELLNKIPQEQQQGLIEALEQDPRPAYQNNPDRIYFFEFGKQEIHFMVQDSILTVTEIR